MSHRSLLLQKTSVYFHAFNRGTNREQIFFTSGGYELFLGLVREHLHSPILTLHAYCLMPNHFHLVLLQNEPYAISKFMKRVCEAYAKALNDWKHRSGHVFERRYRLKEINQSVYLIQVSRYVHLNPVVARIVDSPVHWQYSSCREYLGKRTTPYLNTETILAEAGGKKQYLAILGNEEQNYSDGSSNLFIDWDVDRNRK